MSIRLILVFGILILLLTAFATYAGPSQFQYRLVYMCESMSEGGATAGLPQTNVQEMEAVLDRAKAAGYNGIVFSENHFERLDLMNQAYFRNLQQVLAYAKNLGLDVYPEFCTFGCSWPMLAHDPNLAEGFPVKNAVFKVNGTKADLDPTSDPAGFVNGGFEQYNSGTGQFPGWNVSGSFTADTAIHHGGSQSMKSTSSDYIYQTITVQPWHAYHAVFWVKMQAYSGQTAIQAFADSDGRILSYPTTASPTGSGWWSGYTEDWTKIETDFNSLGETSVDLILSLSGYGGTIWLDDASVQEMGLVNLLRRDGCPLTVTSLDGNTTYVEGTDYKYVSDPLLGRSKHAPVSGKIGTFGFPGIGATGWYDVYHTPPSIHLTNNSRIANGQQILVSYYSVWPTDHTEEVNACFTEPKVYALADDEIKNIKKYVAPKGYVMGYDEIREGNWCALCQGLNETPGQELAYNVSTVTGLINQEDPTAKSFVWGDMFDPNMNAAPNNSNGTSLWTDPTGCTYYMVNGNWYGSWSGLSPDTIIINWHDPSAGTDQGTGQDFSLESLQWWHNRNPQLLETDESEIGPWLSEASQNGIPVVGVMFCTWSKDYSGLESFAQTAWGN